MTDFICTEEKKNCPFRIFDIENSIATCFEIKNLMTKACEKIKNYKLY